MSNNKKKEEEKTDSIPPKILDALSSLEPELLFRSESSPPCPLENFDISEKLDESKKKKEKEKEYKIGNYLIKRTLGQGTFGKVKLGIYLPSQEKVAIKILEKDRILEKDDEIRVKREFDMLALFNHPNVILVAEIFESSDSFYSVMEYCEGGELFNFIVKHRRLSEEEAAFFYYQLINGLEYIHSLGIVHRDLKPENLLLTKDHLLKIIDFGLSNYFKKGQKDLLVTPCGSPCYASPEMVAGNKYDGFKIDIWSTGIILYAMLCGYLPFEDKDNDLLFEKILECKLVFPKYISKISRDLMEKILVTDPDIRISLEEIKNHPFFIKGKEIFEEEFSVCQIEKDGNESLDENIDLNNILKDIELSIEKEKEKEKKEEKVKDKEMEEKNKKENIIDKKDDNSKNPKVIGKEIKVNKKNINNKNINKNKNKNTNNEKKINIKKLKLNDPEQGNVIRRLNTEFDEKSSNLRNNVLNKLEKNEKKVINKRNSSSMKKSSNRNNKKRIVKNSINNSETKKKGPFKKRDFILMKIKKDNETDKLKDEKNCRRRIPGQSRNKKLVKTNKYNNIKKQSSKKRNVGQSVKIRKNKNFIKRNINYINEIKNQFNSKENLKRNLNKKENINNNNIYNINNTIDDERLNRKKKNDFSLKFYNSSVKPPKKTRSVAKKNRKLTTFETTYNQKNKKNYLDNLVNISSSINKYEKKLNSSGINVNKNNNNRLGRRANMLVKTSNNSVEKNNIITNFNRDKIKRPLINMSDKKTGNINIIDDTKDEDINGNENNYNIARININEDIGRNSKGIIKSRNENDAKVKKNKYVKRDLNKLTNLYNINQEKTINANNYINEFDQKKTIDEDSIKNYKNTIYSEYKKNNNFNRKRMIIDDFNKKSLNNKSEIIDNSNLQNKTILGLDSSVITNNSSLNTIDNVLKTEPDNLSIKQKILKKENPKYNYIERPDKKYYIYKKISTNNTQINRNAKNAKKQNNFISSYSKNLNKTTNNFNTNQINTNHKNILNITNPSFNNNTHRNYLNKRINPYRKKSQVTNIHNKKKPFVTIKNTVINFNFDTGIILASIDKKRKAKKNNLKRGAHNSVSKISNKRLYDLAVKYNNHFLTNEAISNINHCNTNENLSIKKKDINDNNTYNTLPLNEDEDKNSNTNFDIIQRNTNYHKIYIHDEESNDKKNMRINNHLKDKKNEKGRMKNRSVNHRDKRHIKYRSMKLEDFYGMKDNKKDSKNMYINSNEH